MAKEAMKMGEGFSAEVQRASGGPEQERPPTSTVRQQVTGWLVLGGGAGGLGAMVCYYFC